MLVSTRPAISDDLDAVAPVLFSAFKNISDQHGFPPNFDSPEAARNVASLLLNHPEFYGVVAEDAGRLLLRLQLSSVDHMKSLNRRAAVRRGH